MSNHPSITIILVASLTCAVKTCTEPDVQVERLMGAGEDAKEATAYTKADLLVEYGHHQDHYHAEDE